MDYVELRKRLYCECNNYLEEIVHKEAKDCYIFFSSHGLCSNDSPEAFYTNIKENNRYEWTSIAKAIKYNRDVGKIIYVRDVNTNFYADGISESIDSIDALIDLLRSRVEGYNVITIGVSSGGYMATIAGCALSADRIYNISGQYDLTIKKSAYILTEENKNYLSLIELVENSQSVPIYYFCPIGCKHDREQYEAVKNLKNVKAFLFPDKLHAATVFPFNFPDIILKTNSEMEKLYNAYKGIIINKWEFMVRSMSLHGYWSVIKRYIVARFSIKKLKKMWDIK